jgi:hypothetical protein
MTMPKFLLTKAKVMVNSVDLSNFAFSLDTPETKEQVDVSGFNPAGTREYLPGQSDQTITVGFLQGFGTAEPHRVLQPLYTSGSAFPISVMADSSASPSAANPTFSGTATLYDYNGLAGTLNARGEMTATFRPTGAAGFQWGTT